MEKKSRTCVFQTKLRRDCISIRSRIRLMKLAGSTTFIIGPKDRILISSSVSSSCRYWSVIRYVFPLVRSALQVQRPVIPFVALAEKPELIICRGIFQTVRDDSPDILSAAVTDKNDLNLPVRLNSLQKKTEPCNIPRVIIRIAISIPVIPDNFLWVE